MINIKIYLHANPRHEGEIVSSARSDDVVNGVVKHSNGTLVVLDCDLHPIPLNFLSSYP